MTTTSMGRNLWKAVQTVAIADVVMSLDNVIAIAPWPRQLADHLRTLVSIPLVVFGARSS